MLIVCILFAWVLIGGVVLGALIALTHLPWVALAGVFMAGVLVGTFVNAGTDYAELKAYRRAARREDSDVEG